MQKLQATRAGEIIPIAVPAVVPTLNMAVCGPSARLVALMQHFEAAGFSEEFSSLTTAQEDLISIGGFASLTGPQDKELIHLVPQLLKQPLFFTPPFW